MASFVLVFCRRRSLAFFVFAAKELHFVHFDLRFNSSGALHAVTTRNRDTRRLAAVRTPPRASFRRYLTRLVCLRVICVSILLIDSDRRSSLQRSPNLRNHRAWDAPFVRQRVRFRGEPGGRFPGVVRLASEGHERQLHVPVLTTITRDHEKKLHSSAFPMPNYQVGETHAVAISRGGGGRVWGGRAICHREKQGTRDARECRFRPRIAPPAGVPPK